MDDRNLNLILAFLLLGLRRYLRCIVPLNPQVQANIAGVINLPFYDKERDCELLARQIRSTPEFWLEVFIQMGMLMTAGYFFMRALQERPLARPLLQPQASQHSNADTTGTTSPTSHETQPTPPSLNQAGFFSPQSTQSNRLRRSGSSESVNSESSEQNEANSSEQNEANSSKFKKS